MKEQWLQQQYIFSWKTLIYFCLQKKRNKNTFLKPAANYHTITDITKYHSITKYWLSIGWILVRNDLEKISRLNI